LPLRLPHAASHSKAGSSYLDGLMTVSLIDSRMNSLANAARRDRLTVTR
jgi:hypothetical protein